MRFILNTGLLAVLVLAGCGESSDATTSTSTTASTTSTTPQSSAAALPAGLHLHAEPADAISLTAAKSQATPGAPVVMKARVGGNAQPMPDGRAMMLVADPTAMLACDAIPDDPCGTPWDFCCVETAKLKAATGVVQVVDADGKLVKAGLDKLPGLRPGSYVVIRGRYAATASPENLIIDAEGIYVTSQNQ